MVFNYSLWEAGSLATIISNDSLGSHSFSINSDLNDFASTNLEFYRVLLWECWR